MRIFLDTNVLASALATRGLCSELLQSVFDEHEPLLCEPVLQELERVLAGKFRLPRPVIVDFLALLRSECEVVATPATPALHFEDPDDIPILASAISARADTFVTGDKGLLALGTVDGIPILSPRQLWQTLAGLEGTGS